MACSVTLNNFVNSESTGGSFAFIGFSSSIGGSYTCSGYTWTGGPACNTAGTTPVSGGYTAAVDFTGTTVGFYKFRYSVGSGSCADSEDFIIQVVARPDSGTPNNPPPFCSGDTSTLTLASYLTGESTGGTWTRTTGTGGTFNAGAGTFNLTGAAVGTHTFKYTVTLGS